MTRKHRSIHFYIWCLLGPLALIVLCAAVAFRAPSPADTAKQTSSSPSESLGSPR